MEISSAACAIFFSRAIGLTAARVPSLHGRSQTPPIFAPESRRAMLAGARSIARLEPAFQRLLTLPVGPAGIGMTPLLAGRVRQSKHAVARQRGPNSLTSLFWEKEFARMN
jgi:hypothetical protein